MSKWEAHKANVLAEQRRRFAREMHDAIEAVWFRFHTAAPEMTAGCGDLPARLDAARSFARFWMEREDGR